MTNYAARVLVEDTYLGQAGLLETRIIAPHVPPCGAVKTRVQGKLYDFKVEQFEFEGWGLFQPRTSKLARLVGEAPQPLVEGYLSRFPRWEMRLVRKLRGSTWLGYARQAKGSGPRGCKEWFNPSDGPMTVQLVEGASTFAVCHARFDGRSMWFEGLVANADQRVVESLRRSLVQGVKPQDLRIGGLSQLDRSAYSLEFLHRHLDSMGRGSTKEDRVIRLETALARLRGQGQGAESWLAQWIDCRGELHTSTIIERDLSVASAGICLAGPDQFDLTSLVGVLDKLA